MKYFKKHHRLIATFFLIVIFPTLVPTNLFAGSNGPKSPEAASFEPVDATDMVNLITGQYSYVLPLLNVPSPEGGYPISLGYHAGIAMDQEASWAGLGWNVNPGAIDRSINGYADDYNGSRLDEYFWDRTRTDTRYTASLGWSGGFASVGVGFNWGNNQALGGVVSVGVGLYGPEGSGVGVNGSVGFGSNSGYAAIGISAQFTSGLSLGVSTNSNGVSDASIGFNNNGEGLSIGADTNGTTSISGSFGSGSENLVSLGVSFSSEGVGITGGVTNKTGKKIDGGAGVGMSIAFNNTVSMGDYVTETSGWNIPLIVPTSIGVFSASFGKQEFKYALGKNVANFVTGPLFYKNRIDDVLVWGYTLPVFVAHRTVQSCQLAPNGSGYCPFNNFPINGPHGNIVHNVIYGCSGNDSDGFGSPHSTPGGPFVSSYSKGFMDINEVSINAAGTSFDNETNVSANSMNFPAYDNFAVSGQGISGSMSATIYKNGALIGLDSKENKDGFSLKYAVNGYLANSIDYLKFNNKPTFDFDNEITSYLNVEAATFNSNGTAPFNYYITGSSDINDKPRRRISNFIEYFTNSEINTASTYTTLKANGYLQPTESGFNRGVMPADGIGAFKITAIDGKTYHYSLPVYNHEIITRTNGVIPESLNEWESYFEKRQLEPFATHWLLTAVTGPDFIDNGDGIAGSGDLGYWTSFEYGKWSDAYIWKNPYMKDKYIDEKDPRIQTWVRGRKQLYYLNKIKTRTHTAVFVKSARQDAQSPQWNYDSASHLNDDLNNTYTNKFIVPSQNQLRLDKIILLKNEDDTIDKTFGSDANSSVNIAYNNATKPAESAGYQMLDAVVDSGDNWSAAIPKAIKVIEFNYDYSLVPGNNRLTLKSVNFNGKANSNVLPPYKFEYLNDSQTFNIENKDGWGYNATNATYFSLNKITTPQGGIINIGYENNNFISATPHKLTFTNSNTTNFTAGCDCTQIQNPYQCTISVGPSLNSYNLQIGNLVDIDYRSLCAPRGDYFYSKLYVGSGYISEILPGNGNYKVTFSSPVSSQGYFGPLPASDTPFNIITVNVNTGNNSNIGGGPRVSNIKVSDGVNNYFTDYKYGTNENGIGYVSYVPYSQNVTREVQYSSELPAPRVMYEYTTVASHKEGVSAEIKTKYQFNILKGKEPYQIKYGSFYEIVKTTTPATNTNVSINSFTVKENFAALGQLLKVSTLNGQGQILSNVFTNYHDINSIPNNIGVTKESYQSYKTVDYTNASIADKLMINSSTRIKYPSIAASSTEQKMGYSYTTQFNDYDLISGVSKEQVFTSSDGKSFKTKTVPAYLKYPQMGSKVDNINNKNMLSQTAAEYSYILDNATNAWKETGVGITTWNNVWAYKDIAGETSLPANEVGVWRKHKTYIWNGVKDANGIFTNYNAATDDGFDWALGIGQPVGTKWKQISEVTLYDHFSMPLEMKDINNNLAATKMGDNNTKVMSTGNAGYNELFYAGAENIKDNYWLESEVRMDGATRDLAFAHTGKYSVATTSTSQLGVFMRSGQHRAGKYKLSVWVKRDNESKARVCSFNNTTSAPFNGETYYAGNWALKTHYFTATTGDAYPYVNSVDGTIVYYDDLMIRPVASSIAGYVYNQWDELEAIIGNNGLATRFEYDTAGRLIKTYIEVLDNASNNVIGGFKKVSENKINYKNL